MSEREKFEAWAKVAAFVVIPDDEGYTNAMTQRAWEAWQAATRQQGEPVAWVTRESMWRLKNGGNDSRVTVPTHAKRSNVSCIPLFTSAPQQEGMVLVPVEPTSEMIAAGNDAPPVLYINDSNIRKIYKAMIAAK